MFDYWAVDAVGDSIENAGESYRLGVFVARSKAEAAHVALFNVPFEPAGGWRIEAHRVPVFSALLPDA